MRETSQFLKFGLVLCVVNVVSGCGNGGEPSVTESLTTNTWAVSSYRTGGSERIELADGCLKDDVYTFDESGTATMSLGAKACPDGSMGVFPHLSAGTWSVDEEGWVTMVFTSATDADCQLSFTALPDGRDTVTFSFAQPCTNTVAAMQLTAQ